MPTIEQVQAAYRQAEGNPEWQSLLLTLFGNVVKPQDNRPVTERIKTFHDAYCELGNDHPFVKSYEQYVNAAGGEETDVIAFLRLRIITAALNEGWQPQFTGDEHRYYPYYWLFTEDEYEDFSEEEKGRVVCRSGDHARAYGGVSVANANYVAASVSESIGSRLAFKTRELAEYAAKQFADAYCDFCLTGQFKPIEK